MEDSFIENFDNLSFDEWIKFVFDSKWLSSKYEDYIELSDFGGNTEVFVENCIKLFENPSFILEKFSDEQLEGGFFGFILNPKVSLNWWLWNKNNAIDLRRKFILSSVNVFRQVFTKNPLKHSCFMWWDCLRDFSDDKDLKVADWMYEALAQILEINSVDCQLSALHGLGHIEHREKKKLIKEFLNKHPKFSEKEYAMAAINGKIL